MQTWQDSAIERSRVCYVWVKPNKDETKKEKKRRDMQTWQDSAIKRGRYELLLARAVFPKNKKVHRKTQRREQGRAGVLAASLHGQVPVFYTRDSHGAEERTRFFLSPLFLKKRVTSRNAKNCNEFNDFRFSMISRAFHFFVLIFYNSIGI